MAKITAEKAEYDRQYRIDNKEKIMVRGKQYYLDNKDKIKARILANKEKIALKKKRRYTNNKEKIGTRRLKQKYSLTPDDYSALLDSQNGVGAICGGVNTHGRNLFVDHCHTTGRVRGLLCSKCNSGLGFLQDSSQLLKNAIKYLKVS